jgi:ABC-type polysaccharide/polyol phosphate transport system ATPase subunit
MTKMKAIKLLVEYAQKFGEEPHNDLVLCIEEEKEWNVWALQQFIIKERNGNKVGVVGNKSGKREFKRK